MDLLLNVRFDLARLIPFLIPLAILQLSLLVWALIDIFKRKNYRFGNQIMWVLIVIFVNMIGPILYLVLGRGEKDE